MTLKNVWITSWGAGISALSFESARLEPDYARVSISDSLFPDSPSEEHPLRHVVGLKILDDDDLLMIRDSITRALREQFNGAEPRDVVLWALRDGRTLRGPELFEVLQAYGMGEATVKETVAEMIHSQVLEMSPKRYLSVRKAE